MDDTPPPTTWVRANATPTGRPPVLTALGRGLACRCPNCGLAPAFAGYLRVVPACAHCAMKLGTLRADDAPPYITLLLVAHIVGVLLLLVDNEALSTMTEIAIFLPLTTVLILGLLRPIKGATLGLIVALGVESPPPPASPVA